MGFGHQRHHAPLVVRVRQSHAIALIAKGQFALACFSEPFEIGEPGAAFERRSERCQAGTGGDDLAIGVEHGQRQR